MIVTAPADGAIVSGTVPLSATASDNVGVAGVRFFVDNNQLGAEDPSAPYGPVSWNTTTANNGTHTLKAVARDAAGNTTTSATVTVTVANPIITAIDVGTSPTDVVVRGNHAYVANAGSNTVSVIDTGTKQVVATIPVGTGPNILVATRNPTASTSPTRHITAITPCR